jgi:hypothetical protein
MSRVRQYSHLFKGARRIVATLRVDFDRAAALGVGSHAITPCQWEGSKERQPSAELFDEYKAWMHSVMSSVVAQTRKGLIFVFEPPGTRTAELWIYGPGEPPYLGETLEKPFSELIAETVFGLPKWEDA